MANRTVTNLTAVLQMNNTKFKKGLSSSEKAIKGFQKQIKAIGGMMAGAFAVGSLVHFGKEAVQVAMKAEGIRTAFERLNKPGLLDELKNATRDTVSELELMQAAVRAKNFKIPLEQLGTFFQFATDRAIQTGESVEYLTQSIIDGIGRKSTLVLDNLGISATQLQDEMKKTGDFAQAAANIIEREMTAAGNVMSTTAIKAAQLKTRFENLKETVGRGLTAAALALGDVLTAKLNPAQWAAEQAARATAEAFEEQEEAMKGVKAQASAISSVYELIKKQEEERIAKAKLLSTIKTPNAWSEGPGFVDHFSVGGTKGDGNKIQGLDWATDPEITNGMKAMSDMIALMDEQVDEWEEGWQEAGNTIFSKVKKIQSPIDNLGKSVGVMLVSSFDDLGAAIGGALSGAEGAIEDLGKSILNNLGNILIMTGMQTGNWPLVLIGAAMQLGSGILGGFGNNVDSGSSTYSHKGGVEFKISGNNLVGVLENVNLRDRMVT